MIRGSLAILSLSLATAPPWFAPAARANPAAKPAIRQTAPAPFSIVALASGLDARDAVAIGPSGEAYEPDHHGAWVRRHAGGIAAPVVHATRVGATVIAGVASGPPFQLHAGAWSSIYVGPHAIAVLGRGPRATAAVGKLVYVLVGGGRTSKLPPSPDPVVAVGASAGGVTIKTDLALARFDGGKWKPIVNAPPHVVALLDDRWVLVDHGVFDLHAKSATAAMTAWPTGFAPTSVVALDATVIAVGNARRTTGPHTGAVGAELVTLHAGKVDREPIELDHQADTVAVVADKAGRIVVATRDGQIAVRVRGAWTHVQVSDELPPDRAGSPPAVSQ